MQLHFSQNKLNRTASVLSLAAVAILTIAPGAMAQFAQPLAPPQSDVADNSATPAGQAPPQPQPPPIGSGPTPKPEIAGDTNGVPPVPTGTADPTSGNWFPNGQGTSRVVVHVFANLDGRGMRENITIRGDTLTAAQAGAIAGVLGVNLNGGNQTNVNTTATAAQLEQIQQILYPSPDGVQQGGLKVITADNPAPGYPKPGETSLYVFQGPLPTVRTFCRYLVILGVVCATVFMALAAYSVVLGHPYGGQRVVGTAAGLLLLLMGYTIWKIVQMETFNFNSNTPPLNQHKQGGDTSTQLDPPTVPGPGGAGDGGANRSPMPVVPFGNAINP